MTDSPNEPKQPLDDEEISHPALELAHPKAQAFFTSEIFWNVADECAPFGSDEGWQVIQSFIDWREFSAEADAYEFLDFYQYPAEAGRFKDLQVTDKETVDRIMEDNPADAMWLPIYGMEVIALAFAQIYVEGKVSAKVKHLAEAALQRELIIYPVCEEHIKIMLAVLSCF